jgi:hypothetical protein
MYSSVANVGKAPNYMVERLVVTTTILLLTRHARLAGLKLFLSATQNKVRS